MRSLDPHHARLGYLGALSAVSVRGLDNYESLVARFRDLLFERFYPDEDRFATAMETVPPSLRKELNARMTRDPDEDPAAILAPADDQTGWLTRSEFWLFDSRLPSHVGYLASKHAGRTVDLARWTGVLLPTLELSESGFLLQYLVTGGLNSWKRDTNLLVARSRPGAALLYLRLLLQAEILFPCLICEFADRQTSSAALSVRGEAGLLRGAVLRLMNAIGEPADPEDILAFRELRDFNDAILKSGSTEDNYLRPRLEMLVDLGLVTRRTGGAKERLGRFHWGLPDCAVALAASWHELAAQPQRIDEFLERDFIRTAAPALGIPVRAPSGDAEALMWFAKAYTEVRREIGFTPGRTVAQLGSLLAAEAGVRLEVKDLFDLAYRLPSGPYAARVSFSGGSRFDTEFMIKIDPALVPELEQTLMRTGKGEPADGKS